MLGALIRRERQKVDQQLVHGNRGLGGRLEADDRGELVVVDVGDFEMPEDRVFAREADDRRVGLDPGLLELLP